MPLIYETEGRAREYCELALNLYNGCGHQCRYCYVPAFTHTTKEDFAQPVPRVNIIEKLVVELTKRPSGKGKLVFLCFTCDPYQPLDEELGLTRQVIKLLHNHGWRVMILTKGGNRALRDFDLLTPNDWFGVTLTYRSPLAGVYESGAAPPNERADTLRGAKAKGIKTWVSLEPIVSVPSAVAWIQELHDIVDHWKVGKWNHDKEAEGIDWWTAVNGLKETLDRCGCDYYIKKDLAKYLE